MKMLLPIAAALLGASFFQAPVDPPTKMGLWESTGTLKMPQADSTTKDTNRVMRSCHISAKLGDANGTDREGRVPQGQ